MSLIKHIYKYNNNICTSDYANDFFAPPLTHRCSCNKSWNIEELDLCTLVLKGTRHDRECSEFIRSHGAVGAGEFIEEGTFTGRREPHKNSSRLTGFFYRIAFSSSAGFHRTVNRFITKPCG